jgi:DNA repair exonuclease SbcCD ATPase subunit
LERENVIRERRIRRPGLASILSIVLFPLAGAAGFMFAALGALPFATSLIFPSAGIVLGLLGFLLGMKKEVLQDDSRPRLALERAAAEWTTRMGREGGPPSDSPALALAWFRSAAAEGDRLAREAAGLEAELRAGEAGLAALARAREDAQAAVLSANAALGSWLAARGAADPEAYLAAQASAVERERQPEQVRERVQAAMSARGCSRPEELQAELRREMASLESVHGALASEAPRPQAEARAAAAAAAYDDCRSRLEAARLKAKTDQAVAGRDESGLLDELSRAEEAVAAARERMDAAALERASDAAALEVFRFLASSGAASFAALSSTTASYYQRAVDRPVALSFDSLDLEKALVPDSGGIGRPPEFLSLGTRDCFVLACRLALAQSILPAGGVLVFDEPFKNLDAHRSLRAMEMIRDYRAARGAQLFFFTKESSLADAARSLFPSGELRVYDLASPGKAGADAVVP